MSRPVTRSLPAPASVVLAAVALGACGGGEPPATLDAPAQAAPGRPPAMAEEKMSLERQVLAAKADLARRLGVEPGQVEVVEAREVTWRDASLGCPEPGMMYAQVLTPGILVVLGYGGELHRYHGGVGAVPGECPEGRAGEPAAFDAEGSR